MVTVTVQPAGLLVCFMIFITGRASGKGASKSAAVMVCSRPKAIRGKKMTPSILASFQGSRYTSRASETIYSPAPAGLRAVRHTYISRSTDFARITKLYFR